MMLLLCSFIASLCPIIINAVETPIVGILAQEAYLVSKAYPGTHSFITSSYVKLLESTGARAIPVWIGQDNEYYERVVNSTNGIVFPGGGTYFNETGGYGEAAKQLYDLAIKSNDRGVYYPLWGVCLGLQVLMFASAGEDIRTDCQSKDVSLPLDFVEGFNESKLFSNASEEILANLRTRNLTYNYHRYCIVEETLRKKNLLNDWSVLSKNTDVNGVEFVSSIEHKRYPFIGTQFHPEKNPFEFKKKTAIAHSFDAIELSQYFANFFGKECRKNNNTFSNDEVERRALIYNYNAEFSEGKTSYEQLYLFHEEDYPKNLLL